MPLKSVSLDSHPDAVPALGFGGLRVLLVAPQAAPVGGMTVQAGLLESHLLAEGARVVRIASNPPVPMGAVPKLGGVLRLLAYRRRICQAIVAGGDVMHVQSASWQYFWRITAFALRQARDAGLRTVLRWDGGEAKRFFAKEAQRVGRVLPFAEEIVVQSDFLADLFRKQFNREARVIPNLVEIPELRHEPPAEGPLRLLCARHLYGDYGVHVVISAVGIASCRGIPVELVVAGDGPERRSLEEQAELEAPGRVTFLGAVPRSRVLDELPRSHAVVNGSFVDNFPVALAEAMAAALPVITTDAGGIAWVVEDGKTGFVTPVGDADALARSMAKLHADRALLARFSTAARAAADAWSWSALRSSWSQALSGV